MDNKIDFSGLSQEDIKKMMLEFNKTLNMEVFDKYGYLLDDKELTDIASSHFSNGPIVLSRYGNKLNSQQLTKIALSNFSSAKLILNNNTYGNKLDVEQLTNIATSRPGWKSIHDGANSAENAQIILDNYFEKFKLDNQELNTKKLTEIALSHVASAKLVINKYGNMLNEEQLTLIAKSYPQYVDQIVDITIYKYKDNLDAQKLIQIAKSYYQGIDIKEIFDKYANRLDEKQLMEFTLSDFSHAKMILNFPHIAKLFNDNNLSVIKNKYENKDIYDTEKLISSIRTENPNFDFIKIIIFFSRIEQITSFKVNGGNALEHLAARGSIKSDKNGIPKKYQEVLGLLIKDGFNINKHSIMEWVNTIIKDNNNRTEVMLIISKTSPSPPKKPAFKPS